MATHHTVINTLLLLVSILFGTISGMAFVWGKPVSISKTLWWLLSALFIWAEYKLLHLMTVANQHSLVIPGIVTAMHSLLGLLLLVNGLRNLQPKITDSKYLVGHNKPLPLFLKKILRNLPALLGVATSAGLGLAYVLLARRQPIVDTYATGITVALLSAILVCDFRALSRLVVPAEIANLRGTLFFTCSLLTASTAITMGALLPVLLLEPSHILIAFGFLIFGIGLGLLVGSILSPKSNDITGQCFATLICLAVVIGASKQQAFWELNPLLQFVVLSLVGIAAFIAAALVEFRRNHFIWRKYATGTQTK